MKSFAKCDSRQITRRHVVRRGAMFNYVMVYITVSSILMTTAGLCLHSILNAENTDRKAALFLASLRRAEKQLRDDSRRGQLILNSGSELSVTLETEHAAQWKADRGILTRVTTEAGSVQSTDRYIFPAGSEIEMLRLDEESIAVRVYEPSAFVSYPEAGHGGALLSKAADRSPQVPAHVMAPKSAVIRLRSSEP